MAMPEQKPGRSKQNYGTPGDFLEAVKYKLQIQRFSLDVAAEDENAVCEAYYTEEMDGLLQPWHRESGAWNWCNPPYSYIQPWAHKAHKESRFGASTAMLVPASVGSNWWRECVEPFAYQVFLNGRLTFVGETKPYPKDCALLFYTPWGFKGTEIWQWRRDVPKLLEPELS